MTDWPILTTVTFLPLVGAFLIAMIREDGESRRRNIRAVALFTTVFTFVVSVLIWVGFDYSTPGFQMVEKVDWLDSGISYHMGVDGISMLFVILTTFLMPLSILASWEAVQDRVDLVRHDGQVGGDTVGDLIGEVHGSGSGAGDVAMGSTECGGARESTVGLCGAGSFGCQWTWPR